jgi:DNA-damage-inducible protein J
MAKTSVLNIRIDPKIKADVEAIYARYGMSLTEAVNVFLFQSRNVNGLPFDLRPSHPNAQTAGAMDEVEYSIRSGKKGKPQPVADFIQENDE